MRTKKTCINPEEQEKNIFAKHEWEQTFDVLTDQILITDRNCNIIRANRAIADRCGCTTKELVGRKCFSVMHGTTSPPDSCPHNKLLQFQEAQNVIYESETLHGIFEETLTPLYNAEGQITSFVHVTRDITEKKRREKLLEEQQKQLAEINRSLVSHIDKTVAELRKRDDLLIQQGRLSSMSVLINSIAHHWRQPLNNIGLIVQNLQLAYKSNDLTVEELDTEIAETMAILQQTSDTIDEFRNFFVHEKEPKTFSVNDAVSHSINFILPALKSKGINVVCDEKADISVVGYQNEYSQALLNIILNAKDVLQQTQHGKPLISICIFKENDRSVVIILDNGGGIAEDTLTHIFDPYFTTKGQGHDEGTGIGLYMSKMIIEKNMNGSLTARNVAGGAEFRIEV